MVKNEISDFVNNLELNISHFKICLDTIERFSILSINNKYVRNTPIL